MMINADAGDEVLFKVAMTTMIRIKSRMTITPTTMTEPHINLAPKIQYIPPARGLELLEHHDTTRATTMT
jgi:hypothetical protein